MRTPSVNALRQIENPFIKSIESVKAGLRQENNLKGGLVMKAKI